MKTNIKNPITMFRRNTVEIIFVFLAFALMAAAAYFSVGRIISNRLLDRAEEMINSAEANVRAGLSEAETILLNTYHIVNNMLEQNASKQEILDYLTTTTEWMRQRDNKLLGYYGIYGFIHGEFYDSMGLNPGSDYIPQSRPWYQTAIRSGTSVAYTTPYIDWRTGDTVVSAVRNLFDNYGRMIGILTIDVEISWLTEYVNSLAVASGGYGVLINQNMILTAHPDSSFIGLQLQEMGGEYDEIARILRTGGDVLAHRTKGNNPAIVFFTRIFNGWYVGIVTPYHLFYKDLYTSALILIALGFVLSISLCYMLLRLSAAKMRADEESKSKSSFLASMSHEIRTPMNAITGMAELILRGELSHEARGYAQEIKHAGNNLISIINDILDISKIEAGKLEIVPVEYMFSSLINDTINIVRMRIGSKPIRFFTNIDCRIPAYLFGDEVRLRQMLLNLLSNAIKYTDKGHIGFYITVEKQSEKHLQLRFSVSDTGKGIKLDDQANLFNDFVRVDTTSNRSIEGTGLGLAITKRLCSAMGGDIFMESEYGSGSTFTMIIPQIIESPEPFAAVEEPKKKKVLVYERRVIYANSISWSLENMQVPYTMVTSRDEFAAALNREEWFYIFSGYGLYEEIKLVLESDQLKTKWLNEKKPSLALLVEWGTEDFIPNVRFVSLPVQSLSIANVLNGKMDSKGYTESSSLIKYAYPGARLLVVDDLVTNLKVAEGLLLPYNAAVETCVNGAQAIELVKNNDYDLVFMDHMMPEMDGIETTGIIRASDNNVPIVALTANAVVGMREMFLEKGFDDFLAKPIDVSKLDEILSKWIPAEKRELKKDALPKNKNEDNSLLSIPEVDTIRGIYSTGGTIENYLSVLTMFQTDAEERLLLFNTKFKQNMSDEGTLSLFTTHVHALKSAAASIGAEKVSKEAAELEAAARAGNHAFIKEKLDGFTVNLTELITGIQKAKKMYNDSLAQTADKNQLSQIKALVNELKEALASKKASSDIFGILDKLNKLPLDSNTKKILENISYQVLMNEFNEAAKIADDLAAGTL